jgi:hypothetical protein
MLFITWTLCQICLFYFIRVEEAGSPWNILTGAQGTKVWEPLIYGLHMILSINSFYEYFLNSINQLIFVRVKYSAIYEVGTEFLDGI